jgi:hypothetical protein
MKLIFSMFGVPSSTPAHENGPAALVDGRVDRRLVGQVDVDGLDALEVERGVVHDHDLGPRVEEQLGGGPAHAGGTTDDEGALPVVTECIEERHGGFLVLVGGGSGVVPGIVRRRRRGS